MSEYAWSIDSPLGVPEAIEKVTAALAEQGFGVLTRIDAHEVLKKKIGAEIPPYVILGACNPKFAHQAIEADPALGILLPCNVVVQAHGSGSRIWVARPAGLFEVVERDDMDGLVKAVSERLAAVVGVMKA